MKKSKYEKYNSQIMDLYEQGEERPGTIAKLILSAERSADTPSSFRAYIRKYLYGSKKIKPAKFEEVKRVKDGEGNLLWTTERKQQKYKDLHEIPENHEVVRISTNESLGQQWVITQPKSWKPEDDEIDYIKLLEEELGNRKPVLSFDLEVKRGRAVVIITDIHFGAYIEGLKIGSDYNITTFVNYLEKVVEEVNKRGFLVVDVLLLGDLIESFTGLNHANSWKGLQKGMFGAKAVKLFTELFSDFCLSKINNLGGVKIVAGNHDRTTSDSKEDTDGGAAELIAWGLQLLEYEVEFSTSLLAHEMDGINFIMNHGHLPLTKKLRTEEICWKYGKKGMYNFVVEGHLHSRIAKMTINQRSSFQLLGGDAVDSRRQVCPSFFPGNNYSEGLGFSTAPGFLIVEDNGNGKPNVFDISL